ncbi:unnamed protein product [Pipistrellus nathusii]|uniref:Uncharacterized protein n=1 Tax=Pipistrellus nathusii TaxID=59473 RepID=A0ABP0AI18_PIPNA
MSNSDQGTKWTSSSHGALNKTANSSPMTFPRTMSSLRTGSPVFGTGQRSYQPGMLKITSNELDHCPAAALHPKREKLTGPTMLPAAGEISGKYWDEHKRVSEMLG